MDAQPAGRARCRGCGGGNFCKRNALQRMRCWAPSACAVLCSLLRHSLFHYPAPIQFNQCNLIPRSCNFCGQAHLLHRAWGGPVLEHACAVLQGAVLHGATPWGFGMM